MPAFVFRPQFKPPSSVQPAILLAVHPSYKETRSILVKGFPFSVVYRPSQQEVLVVAVAPHRKRPQYWAARIE